jgi:hypothetical protein
VPAQVFNTFWHGPDLTPLHWACLKSFADHGHRLRVFTYRPFDLPRGVEPADAREVMPESDLFEFEASFGAFSDIFRYRLLLAMGGWWVDTDVYCLEDDIAECRYAWAAEDDVNINGAILKFPAGDATLRTILAEAESIGNNVKVWGEIGPHLLTRHVAGREFDGHYGSTRDFYPVHWIETHLLWLPRGNDRIRRQCAGSPFVHLWASMFRHYGIDIHHEAPQGSFLGSIEEGSGFPREVPRMDSELLRRTRHSIAHFLQQKWVQDKWVHMFGPDRLGTAGR